MVIRGHAVVMTKMAGITRMKMYSIADISVEQIASDAEVDTKQAKGVMALE